METRSRMSRSLHTNRDFEKLEPYEGKPSRTVLRGEEGSNALDLPDRPADMEQRNGRAVRKGNTVKLWGGNVVDIVIPTIYLNVPKSCKSSLVEFLLVIL